MDYKKTFIVLNKEDDKFCENGATGYCKIETYNNKSTVRIYTQGLKQYYDYDVFLIKEDKNGILPVLLGSFKAINNKNELLIEIDAKNVLSTGETISNFNTVVIYVDDKNSSDRHQFPLIGSNSGEKESTWKDIFKKYLNQKNNMNNSQVKENEFEEITTQNRDTYYNEINHKQSRDQQSSYWEYLREGNIKKISEIMSATWGASEFQPFTQAKLKYRWWKVSNMNFFEDIFKYSILSRQIFKHPLIKKKIREYNYCLFGVVSDMDEKAKYFAFAFPSDYLINDQIYIGGFSVFYPAQGFEKRNGNFGYWVVHVKLDDHNIVMKI